MSSLAADAGKECEKPVFIFFYSVLWKWKALWTHARWCVSWYDVTSWNLGILQCLSKVSILTKMSIFFSSESDQWFKCHVKFWCAATCKFHKARKHRDFRTKHFITSARSSKFNSNIYKLLLLYLVLCFCTKNACSIILMNVLCLTLI